MSDETMNTGDVCRRIGITVTAELLTLLGFTPAAQDKRAMLWRQDDYPQMCQAIGEHIIGRHVVPMQPRPPKPAGKGRVPAATPPTSSAQAPINDFDDDEL